MTCRVDPPSFGINYGSISFGQLSDYIAFCTVPWRAKPPYALNTKYNVARKLAKRNGAIIYAKAGSARPACPWPHLWSLVSGVAIQNT